MEPKQRNTIGKFLQAEETAARVVQTRRKTTIVSNTKSRSSTMPGYSIPSKNQQSLSRGLKRLEDQTGQDLSALRTKAVQRKRSSVSVDAMYQASSSVPDSLVQFARELHQVERITPKQELQLGGLIQDAIQLQSLYDTLETKLQREPTDAEWCVSSGMTNMEAIRQVIEDGLEAKNTLVTSNLRLVQGVVNVYIRNGLGGQYNAGDMTQEGVMVSQVSGVMMLCVVTDCISHTWFYSQQQALIRAAEKFEPERGFRFSTYAMYWIRSAVKRSQTFQSRVITIPQRLHANHKQVKLQEKELLQGLGRPPTNEELAEAAGMSQLQLERCSKAMDQRCFSLDQQINNRNKPNSGKQGDSLYDLLKDKTDDGDIHTVSRSFLRQALTEALYGSLDRQSAHIIMLRYGLVNPKILPRGFGGPLTIAQVSQLVSMKPDKVRRGSMKSLKELKFSIGSEWKDFEKVVE